MKTFNRREFGQGVVGLGALTALGGASAAADGRKLAERQIPSSGETVPIVGLGTNRYSVEEDAASRAPLKAALARFHELGGALIDTAPMYGRSETVLGDLIAELDIRADLFVATKVDRNDVTEAEAQMKASLDKLKVDYVDLMQVHNLIGWRDSLPLIRNWKAEGKARHVGITTHRASQYAEMERIMRQHEPDFIQVNYSLEQRESAERLLPLATDLGIAVIINRAFGGGRIFNAVGNRPLPEWAAEFDCSSWAQFLLKYALSHPAATVAIPGMSKARHVDDNLEAGHGAMPNPEQRAMQERFFDAL
ncbi:MAG: aldo/keto reductase [Pseudomonadota bacterium]